MNIEVKTKTIDVEDQKQCTHLEALFVEYSAACSVSIDVGVVKQLFSLPYFHGFICYVDNEPAGFAVCFESYSTYRAKKVLNIHDFMVSAKYRGKGIGKLLLDGVERYCRDNDFLKITLEVDEDNVIAQKLYLSCDYEDYKVKQKGLLHWQKYLS